MQYRESCLGVRFLGNFLTLIRLRPLVVISHPTQLALMAWSTCEQCNPSGCAIRPHSRSARLSPNLANFMFLSSECLSQRHWWCHCLTWTLTLFIRMESTDFILLHWPCVSTATVFGGRVIVWRITTCLPTDSTRISFARCTVSLCAYMAPLLRPSQRMICFISWASSSIQRQIVRIAQWTRRMKIWGPPGNWRSLYSLPQLGRSLEDLTLHDWGWASRLSWIYKSKLHAVG